MISEYTREAAPAWIEDAINTLRGAIRVIKYSERRPYAYEVSLAAYCHEYHPTQLLESDVDAANFILNYGLHDILRLRNDCEDPRIIVTLMDA